MVGWLMRGARKPLKPMDDALRRRGIVLGAAGIICLFGSAFALVFTPNELLAFLIVPLVLGFVLVVAGYVIMRRAEMAIFEQELTSRKP